MTILTVHPAVDGFVASLGQHVASSPDVCVAAETVLIRSGLHVDQIDRVVFGTTPLHPKESAEAVALVSWAKKHKREASRFSCLRALGFAARDAPQSAGLFGGQQTDSRPIFALVSTSDAVFFGSFDLERVEPVEAERIVSVADLAMLDRSFRPVIWAGDIQLVPAESHGKKWAGELTGEILAAGSDWRLDMGHGGRLRFARFVWTKYSPPSPQWDHDHCEFCFAKLSADAPNAERHGYYAEEADEWVCAGCFAAFKERFLWRL